MFNWFEQWGMIYTRLYCIAVRRWFNTLYRCNSRNIFVMISGLNNGIIY